MLGRMLLRRGTHIHYRTRTSSILNELDISTKNDYIKKLHKQEIPILICTGPTGTGKTFLSCREGIHQILSGRYKKLIITRPTISIDNEQLGYLPGDINKKMTPWLIPIYNSFEQTIGVKQFEKLMKEKVIEICPFAYLRGRTFDDSFVIADEMQNSSVMQIKTLMTRIGNNTKLIINGDSAQSDDSRKNGLSDFLKRTSTYKNEIKYIEYINLSEEDIVRHPVVVEVLDIYKETQEQLVRYLNNYPW